MLRIKNTNTTPRPEKWRFPAVDGSDIVSNSFMVLKLEVSRHYTANGRPVPTDQEITDYLCRNVAVECYDGNEIFRNRFTDPPAQIERTGKPTPNWPLLLQPLRLLAKPGDKGLGDIVARTVGPIGGAAYKIWYERIFGRPCGCSERQNTLNLEYPL